MTVKKKGNYWATVHCSGKDKGKAIAKFPTKSATMAQHRAIEASKHGKRNAYQEAVNKVKA